jgi:hypothetical protein
MGPPPSCHEGLKPDAQCSIIQKYNFLILSQTNLIFLSLIFKASVVALTHTRHNLFKPQLSLELTN